MDLHRPETTSRRQWFRRGLRERSPWVLVTAIAFLLVVLAALEAFARSGDVTKIAEGRVVRYRNDDYGHLGYRMAQLKERPPAGSVVYLLGGSATMECFVSEQSLGGAVSRAAGRATEVVSLAGHAQSFAESLALVENLPEGDGLLAVGLAPMRFVNSPQDDAGLLVGDPFLLETERVRTILERESVRMVPFDTLAPGVVRYLAGYLRERHRTQLPLLADIGYNEHYTIDGTPKSRLAKLCQAYLDVCEDSAGYAENADYNFSVLEELVWLARERGFGVVFFDQPLNVHVLGPSWNGVVPRYRQRAHALAKRLDIPYLRVAQQVKLEDRDFLDDYHLVLRGRLKWQPVFAEELGEGVRSGTSRVAAGETAAAVRDVARPRADGIDR